MWLCLLLLLLVVFGAYHLITANYGYWKKRGVPHPAVSALFGNMTKIIFVKQSLGQLYTDIYNNYPHLSYVGLYKIRQPSILIRSPELLKDILIKEFNSFHDNDFHIDEKMDPIFGKNPFVLKGERWKVVRNQITPCFTIKRIRSMFPLIEEAGKKMVTYLNNSPESVGAEGLEAKELASKFTTDVVASCAFGLEGRAFEDPKSEFREIGRKFLNPSITLALTHLCIMFVPSLANVLNVKIFPDEVANYFRNVVRQAIKYREENNIVRGDFLDLMKALQNNLGETQFTDEDITAHAAVFYADGYETSSFALSYALFELAVNPDVQSKLKSEIDTNITKNGGKLNTDELMENSYLENVILESLRKYPPASFMSKNCTKPYSLPSPLGESEGPDVLLPPGMPVLISIYAIHHDPTYYPNPEKFDPNRFSEKNKKMRPKCTFLSFGDGPRICLGQRFAITQIKIGLANIISNFEVRLNNKTTVPLEIDPQYFLLKAKGDIWLNFYKRK